MALKINFIACKEKKTNFWSIKISEMMVFGALDILFNLLRKNYLNYFFTCKQGMASFDKNRL